MEMDDDAMHMHTEEVGADHSGSTGSEPPDGEGGSRMLIRRGQLDLQLDRPPLPRLVTTDLLEEEHSTEHHRRVGELIASGAAQERAGGLAAIGALLLIDGEDLGPRLSTYAAPLRTALLRSVRLNAEGPRKNEGEAHAQAAADYYAELVRRGRDPDVLELEVRCALDALSDDADGERSGGGGGGGGGVC